MTYVAAIDLAALPEGVAIDRDGIRWLFPGYPVPDGWEWWSSLNATWRPFKPEWAGRAFTCDELTAVRPSERAA